MPASSFRIKKSSLQLLVADIELSTEFYLNQLDFQLDFRYQDFYAGISKDGCSIHLKSGMASIEERKNKRDNEHLDLICSVDGIEQVYEILSKKSIEIIQPLRHMPYGKEFYIIDPDGYMISFFEET